MQSGDARGLELETPALWRISTVSYGSAWLAFPLQFSTASKLVGLQSDCYSCVASTAVT